MGRSKRIEIALAGMLTLMVIVVGCFLLASPSDERPVDESTMPQLPPGHALPAVVLPNFRFEHPRLPHPTAADLAEIAAKNPRFLRQAAKRTSRGQQKLDDAILQARIEPSSVDLDGLHRQLMELQFSWRGHEQAKPLALAYDWLYDQWADAQRMQLRGKLIEGCNYLIEVIRKERLSPYNVFLYNSPFQALIACSLSTFGDDPRADPVMRFTFDLWTNRVLPVWRQIMGQHGGWHEGGEYVGIGVGQAVYQVPAMWRHATGEDFFGEPGIRGFLNFLVYRTRPDGTHMRWGDGAFHDRAVPDRVPLAIELRHAAAYSLGGCPNRIEPTAWPWGPLPDSSLCDPHAVERLPLTKFFDGIGLLVARTGWGKDATYLTFKGGDNYWSHSHLDQGAFTLFKRGALAIDSGAYAGYGSDHHLNYSYQAIAHNLVTVTDPADTVPMPGKKDRPPRGIANDGGQRRVGSGWGVEAAPLDLDEWLRKRGTYRTGQMLKVHTGPDLAVAVADVTPAYTNPLSGKGTFSHRTRRVEALVRSLGFDLANDVVVIHDRVEATNQRFRKDWLLHSIERPALGDDGFVIRIGSGRRPDRPGGELRGAVLLPKAASLELVGGGGAEFLVDGMNYDNAGAVWDLVRKRPHLEPGAWRVVLSPAVPAAEDRFLVVLALNAGRERPVLEVRLLEEADRYGCEIVGQDRTTRWWFDSAHEGPVVEVVAPSGVRTHDLRVTALPDP